MEVCERLGHVKARIQPNFLEKAKMFLHAEKILLIE